MARAKYQVLVIPFYIKNGLLQYCIFHRSDMNIWQFIAGGGEDGDVSTSISAKREANEEAQIDINSKYFSLDSQSSIPTYCFKDARKIWGENCLIIPEYSFAVQLDYMSLELSHEHVEYEWVDYDTDINKLTYDSNKTALWELDNKIKLGLLG